MLTSIKQYVSGTVLRTLCELTHLVLPTTLLSFPILK